MTALAIGVLAATVALAVLSVGVALVARERGRRQRIRLEDRRRAERLIWQRLEWVAGPLPSRPGSAVPRATAAPTDQEMPEADPTHVSPRRQLWRDTSAVLFVGVLAVLAVGFLPPPGPAPQGGVLGVTSSPASSPAATARTTGAAPQVTPPIQGSDRGTLTGPAATRTPRPSAARESRPASTPAASGR
jgi:hypothetical protein